MKAYIFTFIFTFTFSCLQQGFLYWKKKKIKFKKRDENTVLKRNRELEGKECIINKKSCMLYINDYKL